MSEFLQQIRVDFGFPVCFTQDVFAPDNPVLARVVARLEPHKLHQALFVVDQGVADAAPALIPSIHAYCETHRDTLKLLGPPLLVPGGEAVKNDVAHVLDLVEHVNRLGIDRHSYLVVVGGGAVLDMACFAAAISHRGVRCVRLPTTVLSQDDSGVGVKSGINLFGKKNFMGAFMPPFAVVNDIKFMDTLPKRDKIAGLSEAVKVAVIRDAAFFRYLETHAARLAKGEVDALAYTIRRSAELHMEHMRTGGDPFEMGSARPLDYGHWTAHKMEAITHHRLRHGEAVAMGMALDTVYAVKRGLLKPEAGERVLKVMEAIGLSLWDEEYLTRDGSGELVVLQGLREFREHLGGELHITLLREIGQGFEVTEMDEATIVDAIHALQARADGWGNGRGAPVAAAGG